MNQIKKEQNEKKNNIMYHILNNKNKNFISINNIYPNSNNKINANSKNSISKINFNNNMCHFEPQMDNNLNMNMNEKNKYINHST